MRLIKRNIFIITVFLISLFLRVYKLDSLMQFIPDQGWFYLSARDMILTGNIPLVGPPTSHPWIHHGPLWTYTLALLLLVSRFNPVGPAYFIAFLGSCTVVLLYVVFTKMFSRSVGVIAALLFATSPLIVMNSRIPYHTSPIPLLVISLFFCTFLWVKGNVKIFPLIMFLLGVLYNHEITTFVFALSVFTIFSYGLFKKRKWVNNLRSFKIIVLSIFSFLIPMGPFIVYDVSHGYPQTVGFIAWVIFRILKLPLGLVSHSFVSSGSNPSTLPEFFSYYQELIFVQNNLVSIFIFLLSIGFFLYLFFVKKQNQLPHKLLLLFSVISIFGLFTHRVPIEADTLLVSPFFVLFTSILFERWLRSKHFQGISYLVFVFIILTNVYIIISSQYFTQVKEFNRVPVYKYITATDKAIELTSGREYNIIGKGELSSFPVFLMPYEYLLWWRGHPVSTNKESLTIEFWEYNRNIFVSIKK